MRRHLFFIPMWWYFLLFGSPSLATAFEWNATASVRNDLFLHPAAHDGQKQGGGSLAVKAELSHRFSSSTSAIISPFALVDTVDSGKNHFDLRELNLSHSAEQWSVTAGISKVFWGATEFVHLVDIINQTDLVENVDGEEKLGQPMLHLSLLRRWGVLEGFILPGFRERNFPGKKGRLRTILPVDTSQATYKGGASRGHVDYALRYSTTVGQCDIGLAYFRGIGREPELIVDETDRGKQILAPLYHTIDQASLDLQLARGEWLWKAEALVRSGQGRTFAAATPGVEYTIHGIFESSIDLGLITEYIVDERDDTIPTPYDNDLMVGLRWLFNDIDDTQILAGMLKDLRTSSFMFLLEGSRRIGDSLKLEISGALFGRVEKNDPISSLGNDDFIRVALTLYL